MSDKFTVLSLFDGVGCARVALDNLGIKENQITYYRSEISPAANKVFDAHFQGINLGDVCNITADDFNEPISCIIAGSPCTQLSSISPNNNEQLDGNDSKLFFEFVRIWKELQMKYPDSPPAILFENVASMKPGTKQLITSILGVEPITIESGYHAPCRRKRTYWTSYSLKDYHLYKVQRKTLSDIIENGYVDTSRGNLKDTGYCILTTDVSKTHAGFRRAINKKISTIIYSNPDYIGLSDKEKIELFESRTQGGFKSLLLEDGTPTFRTGQWRTLSQLEKERGLGLSDGFSDVGISKSQRDILLGKAFCVPTIEKLLSCNPDVMRLRGI